MYSCPTDDIHSIYLDKELPQPLVAEYEAHIQNCKKCAEKLESLRRIKNTFRADSEKIQFKDDFMDKSYERLLTKMSYAKTTKSVKIYKFPTEPVKWAVAAAAVVVAAIVPLSITNRSNAQSESIATITPVTRTQHVPISENQSVIVDGNFDGNYGIPASTGGQYMYSGMGPENNAGSDGFRPPRPPRPHMNHRQLSSSLTNVDVLRPEFDEPNKISIKINVPGLEEDDDSIEIKLPVNMIPDNLSE
ncbi:MAG: hypothetical protein IJL70_09885 [Treponema sp.]|nr:hypothetical protein [Treponema sp.]